VDFVHHLLVPADTSASDPEELEIPGIEGIIHLVEIEEAPGCKGMVYAAVRQGVHQVWPTNPDGALRSDGRVYSTREHYPVKKGDAPLVLQGWSPGTKYPHTVEFRLSVLSREVMEPWLVQESLVKKLLRAFGVKA